MKAVNLRKEKYTHYIGRGSIFGNPFIIGKDGTREKAIQKYEFRIRNHFITRNPEKRLSMLIQAINDLPKDAVLGCYCKPKACHADVIIKIWKELHNA